MQVSLARNVYSVARPPESRVPKYQSRGNQAPVKQLLRTVKIGQNQVQQPGPLNQTFLELAPFRRRDDQRDGIQIPRPIHPQGIAVDVVGDSVLTNAVLGRFPPASQFLVAKRR